MRQTRATFQRAEQERLRELLIEARTRIGISTRALSIQLRKSPTYIARIERGERLVEVVELLDICRTLEMDPASVVHQLNLLQQK